MKLGFCYLAERSEPSRALREIIRTLSGVGVNLVNPNSGRITELVGDGEQADVGAVVLVEAAGARVELTPQFWFSSDTDVGCSFRQLGSGIVRHAYSLDGLDAGERERVVKWAIHYFRGAVTNRTAILLVADPPGQTADVDWDAVAVQSTALPRVVPAVLGLPSSWVKQLPALRGYSSERLGDFELLVRKPDAE